MNRIICDICGSEYAQTAQCCPICGYTRQGTEKIAAAAAGETVRTKVKGGRFSSKNVKKRQKAMRQAPSVQQTKEQNPNKPLLIVIALLLAAIALVSLYIGVRFFRGRDAYLGGGTAESTSHPPESTAPPVVPCSGIVLGTGVLDLEEAGEQKQLELKLLPENTTDLPAFVSSDPAVATVSQTGVLTAVGTGQAIITVTCGEKQAQCTVVCWFREETTAPPQTSQPAETSGPAVLTLDQSDVSFFNPGESFTLYVTRGGTAVSRSQVTWTSTDPSIASVQEGHVTAVGPGVATITAEYGGEKASCIVRCQFQDTSWTASSTDVTVTVGQSFQLTVGNQSGETADVTWAMDKEGIVSIDGKTVTAEAVGVATLTATVDGVDVSCIVRVK